CRRYAQPTTHTNTCTTFPTRRSPDLAAAEVPERVEEIKEVKPRERADRTEPDEGDARHQDAGDHQAARAEPVHQPAGEEAEQWTDRKSTRLNSSHGSISYAVFCLKNK